MNEKSQKMTRRSFLFGLLAAPFVTNIILFNNLNSKTREKSNFNQAGNYYRWILDKDDVN